MNKLTCIESYIDKEQNQYGCFVIEPLEIGQGITLGNSLRRTLLSDLTSFAITGARINNLKHEFAIADGLREDTLEVLLNLKEIIFKLSFPCQKKKEKIKGFIHVKGPVIVTAGMIKLPARTVIILNPTQYICTITDTSELYLEVDIESGKGYKLIEEKVKEKMEERFFPLKPSTLLIDSIFMPVKQVNYKIRLIHDTQGNIKESLLLEIWTNGSISPKRCIQESLKLLMNLFYSVFLSPDFLVLSSELAKEFFQQSERKEKNAN